MTEIANRNETEDTMATRGGKASPTMGYRSITNVGIRAIQSLRLRDLRWAESISGDYHRHVAYSEAGMSALDVYNAYQRSKGRAELTRAQWDRLPQHANHVVTYLLWRELHRLPPLNLRESGLRFQENWTHGSQCSR